MRVFSVDDFSGDDTTRVQKAVDAAVEHNGKAYFPWTGRPYELEDTVLIEPPKGEEVATLVLEGDPVWKLFEYHGPPRKSVFRTRGLKHSTFRNIAVRSFASNVFGFDFGGDEKTRSSSGNLFEKLRFQSEGSSHGNTAFSVGRGGDDHCQDVFWRCEAIAVFEGPPTSPDYLQKVSDGGHTGFSFVGGNTLSLVVRDCTGSGQKVMFKAFGHEGFGSGGSRTLFDNCGVSSCCLVFWVDGGMGVQIRGARNELCGALLVHGAAKDAVAGEATVMVSCVTCDGFFPVSGAKCGLFEPGEMIGLRSNAEAIIQGCEFDGGEALNAGAVRLATTAGRQAVLHLQGNRGLPVPVSALKGTRKVIVDGTPIVVRATSG